MWLSKKGIKLNIDKIKNYVKRLVGSKLKIKVYLGRNKYLYYDGYIEKIHNNIFTVNTSSGIKSFTYSDVATKAVIISKFD